MAARRADRTTGPDGDRTAWATGLQPAMVWREFAALSAIPRKSKQESAARQYVVERLTGLGFRVRLDDVGNVVADIPASAAARSAPTVVLQAHLDMVCEADASAGSDPAVDGVFPVVDDGWVRARGTTLGADDGIGVATALAVATRSATGARGERELVRPPTQLLFTVDEEEDFSGAAGVDPRLVVGRVLINLDAEDERQVIVGSAAGSRVFVRVDADWHAAPTGLDAVELRVGGLSGGHSGQQIDDNLMNALKALGYVLALTVDALGPDVVGQLHVADLQGGKADNAIPREARAVLVVGPAGRVALERIAHDVERRIRAWRSGADDDAFVEVVDWAIHPARVLSPAAATVAVDLLVAMPSGVLAMDESLPGVVRTSTNLGIAYVEGDDVVSVSAPRSSRPGDLDALYARYASLARLARGRVTVTSRYPGWEPDLESPLLDLVRAGYVEIHGREPEVTAVHAGLEAGEIAAHLSGLVAVSIGPTILGAHSPVERVEIASVERFDRLVSSILARLATEALPAS